MKKQICCILLSICIVLALGSAAWANSLTDQAVVAEAIDNDPQISTVTRGEAVAMLWRAAGSPKPQDTVIRFEDMKGSPYQEAVTWAVETGISNGVSATRFAPNEAVTRTQMAAFLYRYTGEPDKTGAGAWYTDALHWALKNIRIFGDALPLSRDNDLCEKKELETVLERYYAEPSPEGDVYILYTSDVHCGVDSGFGYAGLMEIRDALEEQGCATILVDNGDSIQGDILGAMSKGEAIIDLMNEMGYDAATPGNHEFDYSVE